MKSWPPAGDATWEMEALEGRALLGEVGGVEVLQPLCYLMQMHCDQQPPAPAPVPAALQDKLGA